jgi:methyl-accepting chemotaxis protein
MKTNQKTSLLFTMGLANIVILIIVSVCYMSSSISNMFSHQEYTLKSQKQVLLEGYDQKIQWQVQNVISLITTYDSIYEKEGMSLEERKEAVRELVRGLRYGTEGYFWIDTFDGVNVLLPPKPATEGTNRLDWTDEDGKYMVKEFIEIGKKEGGFTDFKFPKLGSDKPEPKRSYTAPYRPYSWVIGTGNYIDEIDAAVNEVEKKLNSDFKKAIINFVILGVIVIVLSCIGIVFLISHFMIRPIKRVANSLRDISEGDGDLTSRLPITSEDEIGLLSRYFNNTMEKIHDVVFGVKESKDSLTSAGDTVMMSAQDTASGISQITENIRNITSQVETQTSSMKSTVSAVDDISLTIGSLASLITKQREGVAIASSAVEEMVSNIASVNQSMDKMATSFENLASKSRAGIDKQQSMTTSIEKIREQSEMLNEANRAISSIAGQTNLLAMNAAIEAAHAGEAGKGFAVVADEIRKLSETSSAESKTIGNQLKTIRNSIGDVVKISEETSQAFAAASDGIAKTEQLVLHIKAAMEEQAIGSKQISGALQAVMESGDAVDVAAKDVSGRNENIKMQMRSLQSATENIQSSVGDMATEATGINHTGSQLENMSVVMKDAIDKIGGQIDLFKV